jgi:hypothetical protein
MDSRGIFGFVSFCGLARSAPVFPALPRAQNVPQARNQIKQLPPAYEGGAVPSKHGNGIRSVQVAVSGSYGCIGCSSYDNGGLSRRSGEAAMDAQRPAECNASAEYDPENLEMWRRVLSASIQPPPTVADRPILRSLVDPTWLREAYRGTSEDIRRLLRPSHQESRPGSSSLLSALGCSDLTRPGSGDAAASSERAAPQEASEGVQVRLRTRR